jgi:lipopolysaccharide biosynthesis glycosyltransferase
VKSAIWIGFDPRETAAFAVCRESIRRRLTETIPINGLVLESLKRQGLYWRPTERRLGRLWDVISQHEMSTEFAISRFLTPILQGNGLAIFMDCDMLVRGNLNRVFNEIREKRENKAVWCVKHTHVPENDRKMDDQVQSTYACKNWSSFMVFDCDHPGNKRLSLDLVNAARGIDLHRFCWLKPDEIGELDPKWNYLVGHTDLPAEVEPKVVHYTDGGPWFQGFEHAPYADEWRNEQTRWASWL